MENLMVQNPSPSGIAGAGMVHHSPSPSTAPSLPLQKNAPPRPLAGAMSRRAHRLIQSSSRHRPPPALVARPAAIASSLVAPPATSSRGLSASRLQPFAVRRPFSDSLYGVTTGINSPRGDGGG
uniref:Uncharacterized protein n=1 Tax=Oryza sativa subsp. japonica TaxID=39947 RepID=Q60DK7_ORYSJ|nr:hypothetical protein LOC_Os03g43320 [Oryza sativa Japonica Group]